MDDVQIADLMIKFRDHGDRDSWEQLYQLFKLRIRSYLYLRVKVDHREVNDCASEFWLHLRDYLRDYQYDPERPPFNWLLRSAMYLGKRYREMQRRQTGLKGLTRSSSEDCALGIDPNPTPPEKMLRDEACQIVRETISSIEKPIQRNMAKAYFLEGRVAKNVADEAGVNHKTGWGHLVSARKEIGRKLARRVDEIQSHT